MSEYVVVPEAYVFNIPDNVSLEVAGEQYSK